MQLKILSLLLMIVSLALACGKMGDPVPADRALPAPASDLKAFESDEGVVLSWRLQGRKEAISRIKLLRNERDSDKNCTGCDTKYDIIADLSLSEGKLHEDSHGLFTYVDGDTRPGSSYDYTVIVCDNVNYCSDKSKPVDIDFIGRGNKK